MLKTVQTGTGGGGGGGNGTVTSVNTTVGELTGGPITSTGTLGLANTAVVANTYGGWDSVGQFTVDQKGRITYAATLGIDGVPVANVTGAVPNTVNVLASGLITGGGALTGNVTLGLDNVPVANVPGAVPNTVNVIAGTGLSGGGALTGNVTISLPNSGVVANTYGNATIIPVITVDAQGRITSASNVAVSSSGGTVTNVATGTGLTGGPITTTGTVSIADTGVTANTYGSSGVVPVVTVNAQGQLTAASNVTIVATQANFSNTATTATLANASMMLAPEGYITILINGVNKKIPYYGV